MIDCTYPQKNLNTPIYLSGQEAVMATNDVCPMSGYTTMYVEKHLGVSESFIN